MNYEQMIATKDLARAAAVLAAAMGAVGLLFTGLNGVPGFVWAWLAGLGASTWGCSQKCRGGRATLKELSSLSRGYVNTSIGAVVVAFVVPLLVSSAEYENVH